MSQPWLDDLSEDWDDRPPFSSPPPILETPHKLPVTRIPRLQSSPALATVLSGDSPNNISPTRPLPGKRKEALAERTNSDNNILTTISNGSPSRSVSATSTGSVVQYDTVEIKPSSSSPTRPKKLQDTPEWKRRLLQGKMGYGDQKDLFSPMGLENMFQPPTEARSSPIVKRKSGLSALKDSFAIPSSPPPWPSQLSQTRSSPVRNSVRYNMNSSALNGNAGYDSAPDEPAESEPDSEDDNVSETGSEVRHGRPEEDDNASEQGSEVRHERHAEDEARDASFQESNPPQDASEVENESEFGRPTALNMSSAQKSRVVSSQTELTDDSFGPVYVTRHRTEDGGVEYAAVDLSKSELEKMRNPSAEGEASQTRLERRLHSANPDYIARRNALRPRNPTPSQRRREQIQADILEATEAYLHSSPKGLQAIQEHLESPDSRERSSYDEDERAVASQIAAFSIKFRQGMKDEDRKRSVTTQDFLDEARLIMDHIRQKGRPNSALQSLAESGGETPTHMKSDFDLLTVPDSPLEFSRPPSREGSKGGWRNPGASMQNARVVSHLRKFKEDDGEDFMASSFRSFNVQQLEERTQEDSDLFQSQSPDIRILTNKLTQRRRERVAAFDHGILIGSDEPDYLLSSL
ncbi:hypothetical protein GTA08_BOTSDO04954 [Neofusicoccum parvum]|uniref:Uncharacterized protein n=1 Tax=Neofusicoccum parvum TaxID=310453 RepID=A0ACB5RR56_9PEZI|nr:hypothetical protein GTA08_BOTSDO04954 [Neofusicoccum parvum]